MDESDDKLLAAVERLARGFEGRVSYLLGDALPAPGPATDDERGGRSGPFAPNSVLSPLDGSLVLAERDCFSSSGSPMLPMLPCLGLLPFRLPSRPFRWRKRCCFFFSPWSRLMIMSRILGRKLSRLACDASWLNVSSNIPRSSSGTLPRSVVSTPIALNAREAMLNSYPRRTYTSETSLSVAVPLDHSVSVSSWY